MVSTDFQNSIRPRTRKVAACETYPLRPTKRRWEGARGEVGDRSAGAIGSFPICILGRRSRRPLVSSSACRRQAQRICRMRFLWMTGTGSTTLRPTFATTASLRRRVAAPDRPSPPTLVEPCWPRCSGATVPPLEQALRIMAAAAAAAAAAASPGRPRKGRPPPRAAFVERATRVGSWGGMRTRVGARRRTFSC